MHYGPDSTRERPHDRGSPSSEQHSQESLRVLANRHDVNQKTVATWKKRSAVKDLPTGPTDAHSTVLSIEEEAIIVAFASTRCCRWMTVSTLCRQRSRR